MSIGFRLTTKCKSISSFQKLLDVVAARHEASVSHTEDYSELSVCRLGNIFFNYEQEEDDIAVIGDCQTNLLGAGFHKAAIDIVDELVELRDSSLARTATVSASSLAMRFTGMAMEETSSLMLCWVVTFSGK